MFPVRSREDSLSDISYEDDDYGYGSQSPSYYPHILLDDSCLISNYISSEAIEAEKEKNAFSCYYATPHKKEVDPKKPSPSTIQRLLGSYKHTDAIKFAAFSRDWVNSYHQDLPVRPRSRAVVPSFDTPTGTFAYYRVIADRGNKYTLVACHVNVHGFHRGDLRFVEVTDRTRVSGVEGHNVLGKMFLGDIVAVTELVKLLRTSLLVETDAKSMKKINQETECFWAVKSMTVISRQTSGEITFAFLENGNAVVKGYEEVMSVMQKRRIKRELDQLYIGTAFIPDKTEYTFTEDHQPVHKNSLIAMASRIASYPKAFGTIHTFRFSSKASAEMDVGFDAFQSDQSYSAADRDSVVETCALMGYSAANSIFNGRFDCRSFPMKNAKKQDQIVKFTIDNPKENPTEGKWNCNNRIEMEVECGDNIRKINGVIESVTAARGELEIAVRVSRDAPKKFNFKSVIPIVKQREPMECSKLRRGFFKKMPKHQAGRRIIETLYGGAPIEQPEALPFEQFYFNGQALNEYQCQYVSMILNGTPLVLGSSPFGCGKSMTIVATAVEKWKRAKTPKEKRAQQLLITQSNYASVNLVDIAKKVASDELKFVRFVSETNWKELPDNCRTSYDMPALMQTVFEKWALGGFDEHVNKHLENRHMVNMVYYVLDRNILKPSELCGQARKVHDRLKLIKKPWQADLIEALFRIYCPSVIMTTADSLQGLITTNSIKGVNVSTIQIDEASQVPEYTLISLLSTFPNACFGLIGDIKQLPPYCEDLLKGKLKDHGVGNTMERAVEGKMFPQAVLRYVYRCHPVTTDLLSELFYDGQLIAGVYEEDRNEFITERIDFWPNNRFPMLIFDNQEKARKMGTSWSNQQEANLVRQFVDLVSSGYNGYELKREQIGVISFYSAQTSVLTEALRGTGVKCGTVDAFQGTEREVIILCCTNEKLSDFMQLANRLNVAMSRARQATIVIGNVEGLRKANYWKTIVQRAEENGCLIENVSSVRQQQQKYEHPHLKNLKGVSVRTNAGKGRRNHDKRNRKNVMNKMEKEFGSFKI